MNQSTFNTTGVHFTKQIGPYWGRKKSKKGSKRHHINDKTKYTTHARSKPEIRIGNNSRKQPAQKQRWQKYRSTNAGQDSNYKIGDKHNKSNFKWNKNMLFK